MNPVTHFWLKSGKVRELESQKVRESQGTLLKKLGGNPDSVNAGVPQGSILGATLFLLYIDHLPDDVSCNIGIYADDTTHYFKCDQASYLW